MERLQQLIAALWFGSAIFLMLSASAAFRAAGNPTIAADVVGSMLTRWHYIALAAPLILFVLQLRAPRPWLLVLLFACVLLAAAQSFVDLRIRSIRNSSAISMSDLDRENPVRKRFGMLHGVSMMLLVAQAVGAGLVVMAKPGRRVADPGIVSTSSAVQYAQNLSSPEYEPDRAVYAPERVDHEIVSPAGASEDPEKIAGGGP
jgi:hypothetical protein